MFHVTRNGFPGFAPGPPDVLVVVEDHWTELAGAVELAKFSAVRIAAGLDLDVVPHRSYTHTYTSPLLGVRHIVAEQLF